MKFTVVMLNYNDAECLEITLPPLLDLVDQIVIVDMGSTDGSAPYLRDHLRPGDLVVSYPRENLFRFGFAHPRNYGAAYARNAWIFAVDSDELLDRDALKTLVESYEPATLALGVRRRNYHPDPARGLHDHAEIVRHGAFSEEGHCRFYRASPETRWAGLIHEEIMHGTETAAARHTVDVDLTLHHLSAFKAPHEPEKHKLYYYLNLKALAYPGFRFGTNDFWFRQFAREHFDKMIGGADQFCVENGLPALPRDNLARALAE